MPKKRRRSTRPLERRAKPAPAVGATEKATAVAVGRLTKLARLRLEGDRAVARRSKSSTSATTSANLHRSAQAVIARLPRATFHEMLKTWRNAIRVLTQSGETNPHHPAMTVIAAIEKEWDRRGGGKVDPTEYFQWPTTTANGGSHDLSLAGVLPEGMLQYLEYRVGRTNGEATPTRQAILGRVFEGVLPPVFPADYMASWGRPATVQRLQKMAESLAAFTRNAKRRNDERMDDAIKHWEADLLFLHDRYYVGKFRFGWPDTSV